WPHWLVALAFVALLAISFACIFFVRQKKYLAVGWFWFLGTLVPVIGLVQVGEQAMADRYTYLPLIGPVMALVWLIADVWKPQPFRNFFLTGAMATILVTCGFVTREQLRYWRDTVTLFQR